MAGQRNAYSGAIESRYDDAITGAKWWSRFYMRTIWNTDYNRIAERVIALLPNETRGELLDVPVGTLVFTHAAYAQRPHLQVVGLDYSQEMLDVAARRVARYRLGHVSLVRGDVAQLPFADASFDYVLTMNGLQVFPDKPAALAEMARVLRPGGYCLGSLYTRGVRWLPDMLAALLLNRLGLMAGPHYTRQGIELALRETFGGPTDVEHDGCVLIFRTQKGG